MKLGKTLLGPGHSSHMILSWRYECYGLNNTSVAKLVECSKSVFFFFPYHKNLKRIVGYM